MVKSVIGEETRLKLVEDRLADSEIPAQVGLIIGKISSSSDRGFIYELIPTPPTEAGQSACTLKIVGPTRDDRKKGAAKGGKVQAESPPSLSFDDDWVAEHARQVSRMLLGGMYVIGSYIWASEAMFKATSPVVFAQTIRGIAQAAPWNANDSDERLLVQISYSPRRWTCRNCIIDSGSLKSCEFKMGKRLQLLQTYKCIYNFDVRLPIFSCSSTLKSVIRNATAILAKDIQPAKALVDGELVSEIQQTVTALEDEHKVELLLPFMKDKSNEACSSEEVHGIFSLRGTVCAIAYMAAKEPISQAISDIKADIINSLQSRLDIISDEGEGGEDLTGKETINSSQKSIQEIILHEQRELYHLSLPRRVLVPWLNGVLLCDYVQKFETFEDVKDRCREIMSMEPLSDSSKILEPEMVPTTLTKETFWDLVSSSPLGTDDFKSIKHQAGVGSTGSKSNSFSIRMCFLFLLAAFFVGLVLRYMT